MKKLMILFSAVFILTAAATEDSVKLVLKDMEKFRSEMNGSAILELLHPAYVEIDAEGNKKEYAQIKDEMLQLDAMRKVITQATMPEASLLDIVSAVFAMSQNEMTPELRETINSLENSVEGKKLAAESAKILSDIHSMYLESERKMWAGSEVISVKVDKESAQLVFKIKAQDSERIDECTLDMEKVNGKWLVKKSVCK